MQVTFTKTEAPQWLLDMWKEIDDKTFGRGFDCFTEDAVCNLGVADWKGREAIRSNLKAFIDTGFTALQNHNVRPFRLTTQGILPIILIYHYASYGHPRLALLRSCGAGPGRARARS